MMGDKTVRAIALLCANIRVINVPVTSQTTLFKITQTYREYIETGKVPTE